MLHLQAMGAPHLLGIAPQRGLHGQGRVTGAQGVVFMGNGRAKQGHDAIAQHLVHRALIAVHGVHHVVQGRVQELLGRFGVEVADQLGGAFEVGKQHGDLLALAFQGAAGGEDFLGEIGRGVGQRRPVLVAGGGPRAGTRSLGTRPDQDVAVLIDRQALALDEFVLQIFQGRVVELELPFEGADRSGARGAGAWRSPGRESPQRSSPTLPMPMRRAEDGVGMGEAVRAHLYRRWVTKESRKSWERVTQR